ncbi:MAG: HAMP domain-containing protein, partial [Phycisphaerae bacterium]
MFAPGRLFWKLFLGNVALLALVLSTCLWLIGREVSRLQDRELSLRLLNQAHAYRELVQDRFDAAHGRELDALVKRISRDLTVPTRITLIRSDGTVLADSQADPHEMEPHDRRPEVAAALRGGLGEDTRLSQTLGRPMRYLAIAVSSGGPPAQGPVGVVRVAMPVVTISAEAGSMQRLIWGIGLLILAASFALALGLALLWTRPIRRITVAAQSLSQGDLNTRIHVGGGDELAALARALNEMRGRLADHLETIDLQRRTLEALLAQLHEGVVVAGPNGRVVLMNPAAARMLDLPFTINALTGESERSVEESIPQHELQQLLLPGRARAGAADGPEQAREIRWRSSETGAELSLLASASDIALPVRPPGVQAAAETTRPGRLLVLADVTPLTRMLQ